MPIGPGTRLGPYEVTALIGEGGMGKVWRAHHTALKRDDALKVLPDAFASDPDRLARFRREAQVLASLNHPNIAHVYGLEQSDGVQALVMELVEGPTLADRIAQGPIPVDEALPIAKQIAEALEAAHEQGIIHRDLKPANVKVRPDGTVKVLDFGLAKALESVSGTHIDATASPTITSPAMMTGVGMLLGTAAYMSPEQARGKAVDKRSDIWAFGCVLFEMLTGKRAFAGDEVSDVLASVLAREPDWTLLPHGLSPVLGTFFKRCLHKDRKQRIGDAQSLRLALDGAFETAVSHVAPPVAVAQPLWWRTLPVALTAVVAVVVTGLAARSMWPTVAPPTVTRFDYDLPEGQQFRVAGGRTVMALSPDGRHFVYNTTAGLYLRTMGELEARLIPGTEGAVTNPFFSPDGESVAYWQASGELKRVSVTGGAPLVICAVTNPLGATWGTDDMILFGQPEGIMRVSASGGTPELVIKANEGERIDGPQLLPHGDSVLFSVTTASGPTLWDQAQVVVQSLQTGERTVVLRGGSDARYVPTGHLVYALEGGLFAVAFDADRLEVQGGAVSVVDSLMRAGGGAPAATANYGVSEQGTLVYVTREEAQSRLRSLVWVDRLGREEPLAAPPRSYLYPRLSPDGTRLAISMEDQQADIWVWDLARNTLTRITFNPGADAYPAWTPDGRRLLFSSVAGGPANVFWQAADGSGSPERLAESKSGQQPYSVSPDGSRVVVRDGGNPPYNLAVLSLGAERRTEPLVHTEFNEQNAEISPDGRWLAYESDESGQREVYVRPFPNVNEGRWLVSSGGGTRPLWARNGQELFYLSIVGADAALMRVPVERGATWTAGGPTKLFAGRFFYSEGGPGQGRTYDVSPDGRRFLMVKDSSNGNPSDAPSARFVIVQNWLEELKRRVPTN